MIKEEGKIQLTSERQVRKVLEALSPMQLDPELDGREEQELAIIWGENGYFFDRDVRGYNYPEYTLVDFGIDERGNEQPKPFKDGDRVVCDAALTAYIRAGKYDDGKADADACLTDLSIKDLTSSTSWLWVRGEGVNLAVNVDGSVGGATGGIAGHILHAPTFGNLKAGDPNPFEVDIDVTCGELGGGVVVHVEYQPSICVDFEDGRRLWFGFKRNGESVYNGEVYTINDVFPVRAKTPEQKRVVDFYEKRFAYPELVQSEIPDAQPVHTYEFGDKVRSDNGHQWWVVGTHKNLVFIVGNESVFKSLELGEEHEDNEGVEVIHSNRLTPWPTSEIPEAQPAAKPSHTFQFGDKVSRFNEKYYFLTKNNGVSFVVPESDWGFAQTGEEFLTESFPPGEIIPWPATKTFYITPNRPAIVENGTVTFEGITLTKEQLEYALEQIEDTI